MQALIVRPRVVRVADADGMRVAGERLRQAVQELAIEHPGNAPHGVVTISLGGRS